MFSVTQVSLQLHGTFLFVFFSVFIESDQKSTKEQLIAPNNIKQLDESDDNDYDFTDHFTEPAHKVESSTSEDGNMRKRWTSSKRKNFECFICHKKLTSSFVVKRHMTKIHRHDDLKCQYCNTKFRTSRYYERHNCMSHPDRAKFVSQMPIVMDKQNGPVRTYECTVCKRVFSARRQLQSHMTKHKQSPCLCLICGKLFSGDRTLARHMKLHDAISETHPCTECGRKFKQRRYLLDHNRKVHNLYADEGPLTCESCDQQFGKRRLGARLNSCSLKLLEKHPFSQ